MGPETARVERGTRASRIFAVAGGACAWRCSYACRGGAEPGEMRLIGEMAYYLALAQLWNLLAGYAGLVSVGQQAYVGLGAYAFFYMTGALNMNVYLALLLAGPFAGLMSIPVSFAVFRLRGAYFAVGTWVVSEVFALLRKSDRGARRRLGPLAHARRSCARLRPTGRAAIRSCI